jgi:dipeptidyl aminopeptidase/acylaminoacyl peptidase
VYRLEVATGQTTLLTDGQNRHGGFVWSHDGTRFAYTGNARNGRDMDLYLGDGQTREAGQLLLEREGHWDVLELSRDNAKLLVMEYVSIVDSRLWLVDVATRQATRLSPEQPVAAYREALFSTDGRKVYLTSDREGDFVELYELDLASGRFTPLSRDVRWNIEGIALSPDGRSLAFVANEDGWSVLRVLDTRSRRARVVEGIPRGVISELRCARAAPVLAFTHRSATRAGDVWSYDLRRRAATRWTESELGGLNPTQMTEPSLVRYPSFDQRQIPAFVYKPRGPGPFPVVIEIHGGPESQILPTFSPIRQYFVAESGFAVITPNVRGSDGYGKAWLALDDGTRREDSVRDIGALLDWIATQPDLDATRVAVHGGSYGGYMTLASLVHYSDRLRAGVDSVGIANFVTFLENTAPYRRHLRRAEYGDESNAEMRAHLLSISPVTNASRIRTALFVAHGANDPRVPAGEAEQIVRAVRANGQEVWYLLARNEGHGFAKKENRDAFQERMVMFLERFLRAPPSATPAAAAP